MNKLLAGSLVAIVAVVWLWMVGTTENPVRDAREKGWHEFQRASSPPKSEQDVDPIVLFASSLAEIPPSASMSGHQGVVYVPAYSRIRLGSGRGYVDLATTVSIHNSSRDTPIVLNAVAYHSTEGELVQSYLERPVALKPLGTIEVFVPGNDLRGGTGANFVVDWGSVSPVAEPVIEAVMIGTVGATSYSFVSQGRSLRTIAMN